MSHESAAPLRIEAGPSRRLAVFLVTAHAAALLVCLLLPLALQWRLLLAVAIAASLVDTLRTHAWRVSPRAVVAADVLPGRPWVLHRHNGTEVPARLLGSSFVHPRLLVLNFRSGRFMRCNLVLAEDAADADLLRQLRVRLMAGDGGEGAENAGNVQAR